MPPKKAEGKPAKVAVDKTFGMKNKKGKVGQQAVALAKQQASQKGRTDDDKRREKEKELREAKKEADRIKAALDADLFRTAQVQQKAPFGVDPKTVLCINFKNGHCERGAKCKFAHDLNVGRKTEKKDLYSDSRDDKPEGDTMENWTEEKLREVIASKMGTADLPEPSDKDKGKGQERFDIVCKHFIDAIENQKYGWFWDCPNGGTACRYRHALPPGFVLKSQRKKEEEEAKAKEISLEEFLEVERHKLPKDSLTPVTAESFAEWKKNRLNKKEAEADALKKSKEVQAQAGKIAGMSGRDLFTYNPLLLEGDDEDEDDDDWDLEEYRKRAMEERDEAERERMRILEEGVAGTQLNGS